MTKRQTRSWIFCGAIAIVLFSGSNVNAQALDFLIYEQPLNGNMPSHFSNINSSLVPLLRFDDFEAPRTGSLTQLSFWGKGWNFLQIRDCNLDNALSLILVEFYTWRISPLCGWVPDILIKQFAIPWSDVTKEFVNPTGLLQYKYTVVLSGGLAVERDQLYGLLIAGVLINPSGSCIFAWSNTSNVSSFEAIYVDTLDETCPVDGMDQAFALHMGRCTADILVDQNDEVNIEDLLVLLGNWGPCELPCTADIVNDGTVDVEDLLVLLGDWGPCP